MVINTYGSKAKLRLGRITRVITIRICYIIGLALMQITEI